MGNTLILGLSRGSAVVPAERTEHKLHHVTLAMVWRRFVGKHQKFHSFQTLTPSLFEAKMKTFLDF